MNSNDNDKSGIKTTAVIIIDEDSPETPLRVIGPKTKRWLRGRIWRIFDARRNRRRGGRLRQLEPKDPQPLKSA